MVEPTLAEVLLMMFDAQLLQRHFSMPGKVIRYYPKSQTADVMPVIKSPLELRDGTIIYEELPIIHDVLVAWQRGGDCSLHMPMEKGDHVTLVFSEVATGQWRATGEISKPGDLRRNDLSYPIAIPGTEPDNRAIAEADATMDEVVLALGTGKTFRVGAPSATAVAKADPILTWSRAVAGRLQAAGFALDPLIVTAFEAALASTKLKAE